MSKEFKEKLKSLSFSTGGPATNVKTDELGNTTTEHHDGRVDVNVRPQSVEIFGGLNKEDG